MGNGRPCGPGSLAGASLTNKVCGRSCTKYAVAGKPQRGLAPDLLAWALTLELQDSNNPTPHGACVRTMVIHEGEVAILGAQGEFELHIPWCYVFVSRRDLHHQLECGR